MVVAALLTKTESKLRTKYVEAVEAMISRHPIQAQHRSYHYKWAGTAGVGCLLDDVTTKGDFTHYRAGSLVLFTDDAWGAGSEHAYLIWGFRADGDCVHTLVDPSSVASVG